ncbi:Hypothetical protein R9X50_00765000 [Acrodontium crateriforme]|uniref:Uncharacterized protein n=1 Tax=Acrodontium crateriforme TaxID=150365 RepID=A0AAQ3RCV2_9PEZI|nr:Hypothetical protein R9X50_00765000 [Acrodontium crateriforme]
MTVRRYSIEQLLRLKDSPLVQKPENLPAIEQWIDESQQQNQQQKDGATRRPQARPAAGDASPMGNFSTGQRPGLIQTRPTTVKTSDDVALGPPRTVFASSRTSSKLADLPTTSDNAANDEPESGRNGRTFGDKQTNRRSQNDAEPRFNRESWTSARERRALGVDDDSLQGGERNSKVGRRDRDKEQDGERRNGFGDKSDNRWGQRDDRRANGERQGGWREREREKRDRDWDRNGQTDKEPEWMDDPAPKDEDFSMLSMPKNQEDFEKWKQAQHARTKKPSNESATEPQEPAEVREPPQAKNIVPLKIDGLSEKPFGGWNDGKRNSSLSDTIPTPAKTTSSSKAKSSRFMPMFKKDESREETPPADTHIQQVPNQAANNSAEDKEGFQRILQMLGGTNINQSQATIPTEPMSPGRQNGSKPKSRFTGFFDQAPKSPEMMQSQHGNNHGPFQPLENQMFQSGRGSVPEAPPGFAPRMTENQPHDLARSGEANIPTNGGKDARPQSKGTNEHLLHDPPSRGASTPDVNIQHLLATQRNQRTQGQDNKNQEFLLNLLQQKGTSRPPSQQARPEGTFPLWIEQAQGPETHAPRPRMPPSASLFEDQLLRNQLPEMRQDHQPIPGPDAAQRRAGQRLPPNFMDEQTFIMQQQQRRNMPEGPQQHAPQMDPRLSRHPNMPPQQPMQMPPGQAPYHPEYLQSPGMVPGPPPGFNMPMQRLPPGFSNMPPNMYPGPPPREPPGFNGNGMMPPNSPPNGPLGFFPGVPNAPPGLMQMRSPVSGGIPVGPPPGMPGNGRGFDGFDGQGQHR